LQSEALSAFVADKLDDMKARDIVTINITDKADFADYMVVCTGNSTRHVKSLAQYIISECRLAGVEPLGLEGNDVGEWALVDLGDVIVHIMIAETRDTYNLEQLWQNH
jgi:ribosome-associated protein